MPLPPLPDPNAPLLRPVDRARIALRCGEPVAIINEAGQFALVLAVETLTTEALARLRQLTGTEPILALTRWRAAAVGLTAPAGPGMVTLTPTAPLDVEAIHALVEPGRRSILSALAPLAGSVDFIPASPDTDTSPVSGRDGGPARPCARSQGRGCARPASEGSLDESPSRLDGITAARPDAPALQQVTVGEADAHAVAAVRLSKLAALLPTAAMAVIAPDRHPDPAWCQHHDLRLVSDAEIAAYQRQAAQALHPVAEARVPLADAPNARIIAFRPGDGGHEHLAIVIGEPQPGEPVLIRLHSECFTGDLLGSLRCDCGEQLRRAVAEIAASGNGIVLYLAQEGRGIGLVNKLRAYQLQDQGYDTLDANERLGFDADERLYLPAAEMLRRLGFDRVRLMTNNPDKMAQLARCGIEVVERVPHIMASNDHNEAYLRTKALRSGHLF